MTYYFNGIQKRYRAYARYLGVNVTSNALTTAGYLEWLKAQKAGYLNYMGLPADTKVEHDPEFTKWLEMAEKEEEVGV